MTPAPYLALNYDTFSDCKQGVVVPKNQVVRNVDEEVTLASTQRTASHGPSAEAEYREILNNPVQKPRRRPLADVLASMPDVGKDADFDVRSQ
jgi:plasmid stability protein